MISYCHLSIFNSWHIRLLEYSIEFNEDVDDEEFLLDDSEIDDVQENGDETTRSDDVEARAVDEDVKM